MAWKLTRRARLSALAGLAATCLAGAGGCGSSSHPATKPAPPSQTQPAASVTRATQPPPAATPGGAAPPSAAASVVSGCTAEAAGDPGQLAVCLARHGAKLSGDPRTTRCIRAAQDATAFKACLTAAAK
jgi:hypothetical protein